MGIFGERGTGGGAVWIAYGTLHAMHEKYRGGAKLIFSKKSKKEFLSGGFSFYLLICVWFSGLFPFFSSQVLLHCCMVGCFICLFVCWEDHI